MLGMTPDNSNCLQAIASKLGIESAGYDYAKAESIVPSEDFMLGGGERYELSDPFDSSLSVSLREAAHVWATTGDAGAPLIWSNDCGSGRTVVCNIGVYDKVMRGFYAAAISLLGDATAYPVINSAVFYLDDFPSPVPSGDGTMRSMLLPVLYLLGSEVPVADVYHAISTGYGGLLACLGSSVHHAPVLLTEHGIYTREREEEIIRADWVVPSFKDRWIRFFYLLSEEIYRRAFRVTSLFHNARKAQIDMGCDADKCLVIPNGIQFDRFKDIPLKPDDGWVDIGAVVRLAPIKDVKTMIYAFFELHERLPKVRLHIMGGVDDEEYGAECHALVETLGVRDLIFTGRVNVVEYMEKLDFTILTSISEGQPLSVLESLAACRPCVTTEVGCCRELLEGAPGDDFGVAGFVTPPMYRKGLADAMERMCTSRARRIEMGERGKRRVATYFLHEQMLANYRALYDVTAQAFDLPREGE